MKCHMKSESHLRQMKVFADNPDQIISQYSKQFEKAFLDVLSHGHGTKRVAINKVYKEYISHKEHVSVLSLLYINLLIYRSYCILINFSYSIKDTHELNPLDDLDRIREVSRERRKVCS